MKYRESYKNQTILITGGAGCIGSNLTKALIPHAKKIIVLDDLSAAREWNVPISKNVQFVKGSILDEAVLKRLFSEDIDYVFHLAAHFANQNSVDHPELDLIVNGMGILNVLQYSVIRKIKRFVYSSSGCSVYGSKAPLPLKEDYVSLHLDTPYQITKLLGELYCNYFMNQYGLKVGIARYFNVFGPGEVPGQYRNVIPNFIWKGMHDEPLVITGTGEETRDFTYVEDIVDGTLRIGCFEEAIGQAFNLASEKETMVNEIAEIINKITKNKSGVEYTKRRDWDQIVKRRASIEKAHTILGYTPQTDVQKGIKNTYQWLNENYVKIRTS